MIASLLFFMPDVLVRGVDSEILAKLKKRAEMNGRSLQTELVEVFNLLVESEPLSDADVAAKIKRSLRGRKFTDSAISLREDRAR
jgi:plasmid stability protein